MFFRTTDTCQSSMCCCVVLPYVSITKSSGVNSLHFISLGFVNIVKSNSRENM